MNIDEVRNAKRWMETQIRDAVVLACAEFVQLTGVHVSGVDVDFLDVTTLSDNTPKYAIGKVSARVDI